MWTLYIGAAGGGLYRLPGTMYKYPVILYASLLLYGGYSRVKYQ
jgi:hypothetical protein